MEGGDSVVSVYFPILYVCAAAYVSYSVVLTRLRILFFEDSSTLYTWTHAICAPLYPYFK